MQEGARRAPDRAWELISGARAACKRWLIVARHSSRAWNVLPVNLGHQMGQPESPDDVHDDAQMAIVTAGRRMSSSVTKRDRYSPRWR